MKKETNGLPVIIDGNFRGSAKSAKSINMNLSLGKSSNHL